MDLSPLAELDRRDLIFLLESVQQCVTVRNDSDMQAVLARVVAKTQDDSPGFMSRYLAPHLQEAMCRASLATGPEDAASSLSPRQKEVLSWAMAGKTNWEIAAILNISERTVKFHVRNSMLKLEASSRAHAVAIALHQRLIGP